MRPLTFLKCLGKAAVKQAELDLGAKVTYYFSNWDPPTMISQLQQAIATKVDGIAFMGHPGDDAADPLIDKLAKELGPHADKIKTLIRAIN